jgi:hypothetical protein
MDMLETDPDTIVVETIYEKNDALEPTDDDVRRIQTTLLAERTQSRSSSSSEDTEVSDPLKKSNELIKSEQEQALRSFKQRRDQVT